MDGKIVMNGIDLRSVPEKLLPKLRREKIGFIFQNYNLIPTLSAFENVELFMRFPRVPKKERQERGINLKNWVWETVSIINIRNCPEENSSGSLLPERLRTDLP